MSKYTFPESLKTNAMFAGKTDDELQAIFDASMAYLKGDKDAKKAAREDAKKNAADNAAKKIEEVQTLAEENDIEVSNLVKSLHRTDKKVKIKDDKGNVVGVKIPQVLCGATGNIMGFAVSLNVYVPTGKGAKLTPAIEKAVYDARVLALQIMNTLSEAGYTRGEEAEEVEEETK